MRYLLALLALALTVSCGKPAPPEPSPPLGGWPPEAVASPQNADPWLWMVPANQSRYHVACVRIDIVTVSDTGEECRFPMWVRGDPILLQDLTRFPSGGPPIVHYLVTYGDILPWYLAIGETRP